jgi:hypothetical protein
MQKPGRFELADRGTLFLDEIGDISLDLQPKLLRALQEHEFERLGSTKTIHVDVRLIAATHRDLPAMIRNNQFREDLFYRLNVFPIEIPPLRERREDIPLLIHYLVSRFARRMQKRIKSIPKRAMDTLVNADWPGNVRELENFIERCVILTQGDELQVPRTELKRSPVRTPATGGTFEEAERQAIIDALKRIRKISGKSGAAEVGPQENNAENKMRRLKITRADYSPDIESLPTSLSSVAGPQADAVRRSHVSSRFCEPGQATATFLATRNVNYVWEMHHGANALVLKIEGQLSGNYAEHTRTLIPRCNTELPLVVDLTDVTFVDSAGEGVLSLFGRLGAAFIADDAYARDLCERLNLRLSSQENLSELTVKCQPSNIPKGSKTLVCPCLRYSLWGPLPGAPASCSAPSFAVAVTLRGIQAGIDAAVKRISWTYHRMGDGRTLPAGHSPSHAAEKATQRARQRSTTLHDMASIHFSRIRVPAGSGKGWQRGATPCCQSRCWSATRRVLTYESAQRLCGPQVASSDVVAAPSSVKSLQELQQLAMQATEQGDMTQLRRYAQQLSARQAKSAPVADPKSDTSPTVTRAACPVDLSAPFTDEVVRRARALGLSVARAEPPPQSRVLFDYVTTHIWHPILSDTDVAKEGTIRAQALVDESGFPSELSGPLKDLVGQFLLNPFINSGGARYMPPFSAETVLVEDFSETQEVPATGELLSALGLGRRACSRPPRNRSRITRARSSSPAGTASPRPHRVSAGVYSTRPLHRTRSRSRLGPAAAMDALRRLSSFQKRSGARAGGRRCALWRTHRPAQHRCRRPA